MIPKKPAPDVIGGGYRSSEKACPGESVVKAGIMLHH
jgi:hypothetical protein